MNISNICIIWGCLNLRFVAKAITIRKIVGIFMYPNTHHANHIATTATTEVTTYLYVHINICI